MDLGGLICPYGKFCSQSATDSLDGSCCLGLCQLITPPLPVITGCYDTDGNISDTLGRKGFDENKEGRTFPYGLNVNFANSLAGIPVYADYCVNATTLNESYCNAEEDAAWTSLGCANGCGIGKCLNSTDRTTTDIGVAGKCFDLEKGIYGTSSVNFSIPGYAEFFNEFGIGKRSYDICAESAPLHIRDFFCTESNGRTSDIANLPLNCEISCNMSEYGGYCDYIRSSVEIPKPSEIIYNCIDSDGEPMDEVPDDDESLVVSGKLTLEGYNSTGFIIEDICNDDFSGGDGLWLWEAHCKADGSLSNASALRCPGRCESGACVPKEDSGAGIWMIGGGVVLGAGIGFFIGGPIGAIVGGIGGAVLGLFASGSF